MKIVIDENRKNISKKTEMLTLANFMLYQLKIAA